MHTNSSPSPVDEQDFVDSLYDELGHAQAVIADLTAEVARLRKYEPRILTERETEILRRLAGHQTAGQVGKALHLSVGTIRKDLAIIYSKLGVPGKTGAIVAAFRLGLLTPDTPMAMANA